MQIRGLWVDGQTVAAELTERFTVEGHAQVAHIAGFYRFHEGLIRRASIYRAGSADPAAS